MRTLLTNEVAGKFNWAGTGEKRPFKALESRNLVISKWRVTYILAWSYIGLALLLKEFLALFLVLHYWLHFEIGNTVMYCAVLTYTRVVHIKTGISFLDR